jgi:hypothetical protein
MSPARVSSVWVVEQGEYSDYRVVGVFSSQANAQQIADAINAGHEFNRATVAEWPLDPVVDELRQGFRPFLVDMREDGSLERCDPWDVEGYELAGYVRMWRRQDAPAYRGKPDKPDILQALIWARDAEHALKITNEHRLRMIATGEWRGVEPPNATTE